MTVIGSIDQLRGNAHATGSFANAAFEHMAHIELAGNLSHIYGFSFEGERGITRHNVQRRNVAQIGDDIFADSIAEIFLLGVATHVGERQYADGETAYLTCGSVRRRSSSRPIITLCLTEFCRRF